VKKIKTTILLSSFLAATTLSAKNSSSDELANKITNFYNILTNKTIEFKATKKDSKYLIKIVPHHITYKQILDSNATIEVEVDEGPSYYKTKTHYCKSWFS